MDMKAAIIRGKREFRIEDVPDPEVGPDSIIVRVKAAGVCGGDPGMWERGKSPNLIEGHEWSGEVAEVGANVTSVKPGDRVSGGGYSSFAEYIPAESAFLIPDDMSYEVAATIEPLGVSMNLVEKAELEKGNTVVVFGGGAVGQGAWQIFKALGASKVILVEVAKKRLEIAREMGADLVINAAEEDVVKLVDEATNGIGADIAASCTTAPQALKQAFEVVRGGGLWQSVFKGNPMGPDPMSYGGKVVMVAGAPIELPLQFIVQKASTLRGAWGGRMGQAFSLMKEGKVNTEPWITHSFPLENISEAFEAALNRDESVKVIVQP